MCIFLNSLSSGNRKKFYYLKTIHFPFHISEFRFCLEQEDIVGQLQKKKGKKGKKTLINGTPTGLDFWHCTNCLPNLRRNKTKKVPLGNWTQVSSVRCEVLNTVHTLKYEQEKQLIDPFWILNFFHWVSAGYMGGHLKFANFFLAFLPILSDLPNVPKYWNQLYSKPCETYTAHYTTYSTIRTAIIGDICKMTAKLTG